MFSLRKAVGDIRELGAGRLLLLGTLTGGHMVVHWFQTLFPVILPSLKVGLGINDIQVGSLTTMRQALGGGLTLPSGYLADSYRKHTALILGSALFSFGVAYFLVSRSPSYGWVLPAVALVGVGNALWHPAANGSLSLRFPERRGTALAIHGVGASFGDALAPLAVGALLLVFSWRFVLGIHLVPAAMLALIVWRSLGSEYTQEGPRSSFRSYLSGIGEMMGNRVALAVLISNGLLHMGRLSVITFLPIYLSETLGYSSFILGVFIALLYIMGMVSLPVMGVLSDRFGRKAVLAPSFAFMALLFLAITFADSGIQLGLVVGTLGLFFYPPSDIVSAAMLDIAGETVQSSTFGVQSWVSQPFSIVSPILAGVLVTQFRIEAAFWYAAIVLALATIVLIPVRFPKPAASRKVQS